MLCNNNILSDLELLNSELAIKKEQIEECRRLLTESLVYAGKLQKAIIPPKEYFNKIFPNHFILYEPKNYVSGDFFWVYENNNLSYLAVADCTGHGVPGAMLSVLGITLLNEISNLLAGKNQLSSSDILHLLRIQLISSLHQTETSQMKDGMDIGFCILNKDNLQLQFSGAFIPLHIVRNKQLIEVKGCSAPIGLYAGTEIPFNQTEIQLEPNDMLYLATDGYRDQFGGCNYKKFSTKQFKSLLTDISTKSIGEQKMILSKTLSYWQNSCEQLDDITVVGVRIGNKQQYSFTI